jgi:pimeloyl-ACP methyl ester carboxylesterase
MSTVVRRGVRLYYSDSGEGPPVFFHTGGGGDGTMWKRAGYLDALPGRRHLVFDHRGHGRSDQPEGLAAHHFDEYIADVVAMLEAAGVEQAAMVGYSGGAGVVYALAAQHPERVAAIVGLGGVPHPSDTNYGRRERAAQIRQIGTHAYMERMSALEDEPATTWLIENLESTPTEMFALQLEGSADGPTSCAYFPLIQAPTLIVCGEHEDEDGAAELAVEALRDGRAVVVPGFGHLQAFWRADVIAPIISDFLARHMPVPAAANFL